MIPPADMTRSFINPKDRAAAVIRRRQEAEAELRRRREERIRQIQEKSENAIKRKQMGLKEKVSRTNNEHLNEVNKRRLEHEHLEKQRLQQLLEKKRSPPRSTPASIKAKTTIAFGSGVPRRLDISTGSAGRSASSSSANGSLNNTANSLMTRSHHPILSPSKEKQAPRSTMRPTLKAGLSNKPPIKPTNRPPPKVTGPVASPRKSIENRMTRSVHPELCPTPNKRFEKVPPRPLFVSKKLDGKSVEKKNIVAKKVEQPIVPIIDIKPVEEPIIQNVDIKEPIVKLDVKNEENVEEPIIKSEEVQNFNDIVESTPNIFEIVKESEPIETQNDIVESTPDAVEENQYIEEPVEKKEESLIDRDVEEQIEPIPNIVEQNIEEPVEKKEESLIDQDVEEPTETIKSATEFGQIFDVGSSDETPEIVPPSEYVHTRSSSDDRDSTRTRTLSPHFSDDEHDSGVAVPETPSPPLTTIDTINEPIIESTPSPKTNHLFLLNSNVPSFSPNGNEIQLLNGDQSTTNGNQTIISTSNVPSDPEQTNNSKEQIPTNGLANAGVIIGLAEKLQQERDNRKAKLNEILSRTRDSSNSASPVKTDSDASSLAKNLLAKHSEKFNESTNKEANEVISNGGKMVSLADEFENLGISTAKQDQFLLPGQLSDSHNNGVSG